MAVEEPCHGKYVDECVRDSLHRQIRKLWPASRASNDEEYLNSYLNQESQWENQELEQDISFLGREVPDRLHVIERASEYHPGYSVGYRQGGVRSDERVWDCLRLGVTTLYISRNYNGDDLLKQAECDGIDVEHLNQFNRPFFGSQSKNDSYRVSELKHCRSHQPR